MIDIDCKCVREELDALLDGYLPDATAIALERHIASCPECAAARGNTEALRRALRHMAIPEPRPGFADAALAAAVRQAPAPAVATPPESRHRPAARPWRRLELWAGATLGAAAAAALMAIFLAVPRGGDRPVDVPSVHITQFEAREIGLAIDAETSMPGATLTLFLEGGIDLVGFAEQRELSWQADLDAGTNMLSLPIIAHSMESGRLTALVEHGESTHRIAVDIRVDPPAADR